MNDNLDITVETYRQHFDRYVAGTRPEVSDEFMQWINEFLLLLPQSSEILEYGSGMGRDAHYFAQMGYKVFCTDVVPEVVDNLAHEGFETAGYDFRDPIPTEWLSRFDGFFASAVLLHATPEIMLFALNNIVQALKPGGVMAISLKAGEGEEMSFEKMDAPRYFHYYTKEDMEAILGKLPVEIIEIKQADKGKYLQIIAKVNTE